MKHAGQGRNRPGYCLQTWMGGRKNMSKYDKMIELNRERSVEKVAAAKAAIRKISEDGERISVPRLMKMTGLSRGFFYKNPEVRSEVDRAMEQQVGIAAPAGASSTKRWTAGSNCSSNSWQNLSRKMNSCRRRTRN